MLFKMFAFLNGLRIRFKMRLGHTHFNSFRNANENEMKQKDEPNGT